MFLTTNHMQKSATVAFDFGMSLGKFAFFATTVGKLRITDQWLQLRVVA